MCSNYNLGMPDLYWRTDQSFFGLLYKQLVHFHTFFEQTALNERTKGGFCPFTCTCNVKMYKYFRSTSQRKRVLKNI